MNAIGSPVKNMSLLTILNSCIDSDASSGAIRSSSIIKIQLTYPIILHIFLPLKNNIISVGTIFCCAHIPDERGVKQIMMIASRKPFLVHHFKRWWDLRIMPQLDWMQIEVTTRCNASCHYCPRTTYRSFWDNRDLSLENFKTLLPVIADTKMVHLQGWGEPFLHPHLFEMISLTKKAGCKVGTTTNGMLLDGREIDRLVKSGIDHVAFSLTGIGEKNDLTRNGTQFTRLLMAISDLAVRKKALGIETPVISIAYLLLRSHLPDIHQILPALEGLGIGQVIISTLDFVPNKDLWDERLSPRNLVEYRELKALFDELAGEAEKKGIGLCYHLVSPGAKGGVCTENPRRALFVSADGSVSPCVFTNIPAPGSSYVVNDVVSEYRKLTFGCIHDESLPTIWKGADYREFRKFFESRPHPLCFRCPKRHE
jgi:MoaA/NifB/PqqE/SkfB family radical SAM enzyme